MENMLENKVAMITGSGRGTGRAILQSLCDNDPNRLKSFSVRFMNVAFPGDTLMTKGWDVGAGKYVIHTTNQEGKIILGNSMAEIV